MSKECIDEEMVIKIEKQAERETIYNEILNLIKNKRYNAMCDEEYTLNNDKKNISKLSGLWVAIQSYTDLIIEIENRMNKAKNKKEANNEW